MPDGYQHVQGRSRILSANFTAPELGDADQVLLAVTDTGVQQVLTTFAAQPDVPRNITATAGGTAADVKAIQVIVAGTNVWGQAITETLPAFTVNTTGTVVGNKAFYRVTSVTIPAHDGVLATTSVGTGAKLGLPTTLSRNTVVAAYHNGAKEGTPPTVAVSATAVESNTVTLSTALDGSDVIVDYYK